MVPVDIGQPGTWPMRLLRAEVATVCRISVRELQRRISTGRFPPPDDGRTWARDVVQRYVEGGIKQFERQRSRFSKAS